MYNTISTEYVRRGSLELEIIMSKLTVEFNSKMDEILADLAEDKGTTKADVLRRAVALYKYIDSQLSPENRRHLAITEDDRIVKEIVVP